LLTALAGESTLISQFCLTYLPISQALAIPSQVQSLLLPLSHLAM